MNTASLTADWMTASQALQTETIALRRAIHREPELGLRTPRTLAKVESALAGLPLKLKTGTSTTGLVAVLEGARPGRTVLLRGDMDALPMPEDTTLDFRSTIDGAMHACGHDAHTAMLVSAARILCAHRDRLSGRVLFMFQPGEEGFHGAKFMLEDGLLDDPAPDAAFAIHIAPNAPAGSIGSKAGPLLASADRLQIDVHGRGGHASMPHHAVDPIPIACEIVGCIAVDGHAAHRRIRSRRRDHRQDPGRVHRQRHSRDRAHGRHDPFGLRSRTREDPRRGDARRDEHRAGSRRGSPNGDHAGLSGHGL